jgi:hypothetical protein
MQEDSSRWWLLLAMTVLAAAGCDHPDPEPVLDASALDAHLERLDASVGVVELATDPAQLDFGEVGVGSTAAPLAIRLENRGTARSAAIAVALGGPAAAEFRIVSDGCTGVRLDPGAGCEVRVEHAPQGEGLRSATWTATAGEEVVRVPLSSTGLGDADLFVSPSPFDFGDVLVGDVRSRAFMVTNPASHASGALALRIAGVDPAEFAIGTDACSGLALGADESCSVEVRYAPRASGPHSATLQVVVSPGGTPAASIRGQGTTP